MVSLALEAGTETATAVFAITWTCQQLLATANFFFFFFEKLHPKPKSPIVFIYQKYHLLRKEKFLFQDIKQK